MLRNIASEDDVQNLIVDKVQEGKEVDYKKELPKNSDADKKEFLADVSSFANTIGGNLIFGIDEDKGIPIKILGIDSIDLDKEKQRLDSIIANGIDPRLKYNIKTISTKDGTILVIEILKSWLAPHRVTFAGHDKFYARNSSGKYPLDVRELKDAFLLSSTIQEKIRVFQRDRIANIEVNETPIPTDYKSKIVLHFIPTEAFTNKQIDLARVYKDLIKFKPMYSDGWSHVINLDGVVAYSKGANNMATTYTQYYRNGILEVVEMGLLNFNWNENEDDPVYIPSRSYEEEIINAFNEYLNLLKESNIDLPIYFFLTLVNVKGFAMGIDRTFVHKNDIHKIDRDNLLLPEIEIDSYNVEAVKVLRPLFDMIWNACGFQRSENFDSEGNWKYN